MRKYLPFAGIVGRVCTRPCEDKCERRSIDQQPVHIRALKRYLADVYPDIARVPAPAAKASGKRVAIVGSGPAGLWPHMSWRLRGMVWSYSRLHPSREECSVGVFRHFACLRRRLATACACWRDHGGRFQNRRRLGTDMDPEKLESEWDAVLLATGGGGSAKLGIPGEESSWSSSWDRASAEGAREGIPSTSGKAFW